MIFDDHDVSPQVIEEGEVSSQIIAGSDMRPSLIQISVKADCWIAPPSPRAARRSSRVTASSSGEMP
jgi:hypothetical protein